LYDQLSVPIGLFSDNWGGTPVQAWSSPEAYSKCKANLAENPVIPSEIPSEQITGPNDPSNLWNAMIVPVLPMTILGALWYQGEANTGQQNYYACAFPVMIEDWRTKWGGNTSKSFGFYFVQLAPWIGAGNDAEALIRLSQLFAIKLADVGFATAADLGDPLSPFGSVHPRGKQEVGRRLALSVLGLTYFRPVQYMGPMANGWTVLSDKTVRVTFTPASIGTGLTSEAVSCDPTLKESECAEYELGTSNGWIRATGTISGDTVVISGTVGTATVTGVRYGYAEYLLMSLRNKEGIPAPPFLFPNPITPN